MGMFHFGATELLLLLFLALLIFGPGRLPQVSRGIATGIREFRQAVGTRAPPENRPRPAGTVPVAAQRRKRHSRHFDAKRPNTS